MAQRQVVCKSLKQIWASILSHNFPQKQLPYTGSKILTACENLKVKTSSSVETTTFDSSSSGYLNHALSSRNKGFIDFVTNNPHKQFYMPTISINKLKVYEDITLPKSIIDPVINNIKIIDAPVPGKPEKKEAVRMILIRRRKMRKHKLRKFRKKYRFVLAKRKLVREMRKEQAFRAELLTQIEAAEKFNAKDYVDNTINSIRYQPRLETVEEIKARYREIMKMNKFKTMFIRPKFDD